MKFHHLSVPFWVILISCVFAQSHGRWERKIKVSVTNAFMDERQMTITCQSYVQFVPEKLILNDEVIQPNHKHVLYDVGKYTGKTDHECFVVWKCEKTGKKVTSIFEAFTGSGDHDVLSLWDDKHQVIWYKWLFTESGLSLYSYSLGSFHPLKTLKSIQSIAVYVRNGIPSGDSNLIYVSCTSNQPTRHADKVIVASKECLGGEFAAWGVGVFNGDTIHECKAVFMDQRDTIQFEAFVGKWHHDDSIWDDERKERKYVWTVKDDGVFFYNFETKENELIIATQPRPTN